MTVHPDHLVRCDLLAAAGAPLLSRLVYADAGDPDNVFSTALYPPPRFQWLHQSLAMVVVRAADALSNTQGWRLEVLDGLRPSGAQQRMINTPVVRDNPQWLREPDALISRPGGGGHPRGMAVDLRPVAADGHLPWMGTAFDAFDRDEVGPLAARGRTRLKGAPDEDAQAIRNRQLLEAAMVLAAQDLGVPLLPLPSEWWDFRLPPEQTGMWAPLSDDEVIRLEGTQDPQREQAKAAALVARARAGARKSTGH